MAKLYVSEYPGAVALEAGRRAYVAGVGQEPALVVQAVTFTTATASSAFGAATTMVRVVSDADCRVAFGSAPTATANSAFLPSKVPEYFAVSPGHKVSVYDGSS